MPAPPPSYRTPAVVERDLGEVVDALAARLAASRAPGADKTEDAPEAEQEALQPVPVDDEDAALPPSLRVAWHPRGPDRLAPRSAVRARALGARSPWWRLGLGRVDTGVLIVAMLTVGSLVFIALSRWFR